MLSASSSQEESIEMKITNLLEQLTIEEKCSLLHGSSFFNIEGIERLGIPGFKMCDGPHGVRNGKGVTAFPVSIALAATWDPDYMEIVGSAYGKEFKGLGLNMALGPAVDLGRDPRNGRASETFGEEPYLGGKVFAAFTRGAQKMNLIACAKHFLAQSHDGTRNIANPKIDERSLREFYGLAFRMLVQEGEVYSVMSSYNLANDVHCSQNDDILNQMLRNEWGFQYFVVSDWWGTYDVAEKLINAGLDVEMPENGKFNELQAAVLKGTVSKNTLDNSVRRVLRSRFKSGIMDLMKEKGDLTDVNSPETQRINLEAAKKSIVLLKNQNILPLKKGGKIALIGPNADSLPLTSFGSSEITNPAYKITTKQGISLVAPNSKVIYEKGCDINSQDTTGFEPAIAAAKEAEVVIFVGGLDSTQEGEAYDERSGLDRTGNSVMLPGKQSELIKELAAANPNLVVVLQSGGMVSIPAETLGKIKGLVYAWYCGNEGGHAIAQILFGDYNPGGKLPIAMPVDDSQLPLWDDFDFTHDLIDGFGYRRFDKTNEKPLFNFGHGLSYTKFGYENIKFSSHEIDGKTGVVVSVDLVNEGDREGSEVAQLYLSSQISVPMPVKQLRGFKRVNLLPGEKKTIQFELGPYELCYWSIELKHYYVEKGKYSVLVGTSSDNLKLFGDFNVTSDYKIPYPEKII